jgi:hypothetical protein
MRTFYFAGFGSGGVADDGVAAFAAAAFFSTLAAAMIEPSYSARSDADIGVSPRRFSAASKACGLSRIDLMWCMPNSGSWPGKSAKRVFASESRPSTSQLHGL